MKDGWHIISECEVYVEDGYILRGIKDTPPQQTAAYIYRSAKTGGFYKLNRITPAAFRAGVKKGTIILT